MSRDGRYILSYEYQSYLPPTPMAKDKELLLGHLEWRNMIFHTLDHGYTLHFELPKYTLPLEIVRQLKADTILQACDGDTYEEMER